MNPPDDVPKMLRWMAWTETPRRRSAIVAALVVLTCLAFGLTVRRAMRGSSEFRGFQAISLGVLLEGKDQYRDLGHVRAYPPFFGIAFFPFAMFGRSDSGRAIGAALFFAANILLYTWAAALLIRGASARPGGEDMSPPCGDRDTGARPAPICTGSLEGRLLVLIWLLMLPIWACVALRCESDVLVLFPLCAALYLITAGRQATGGLLLGFAASFKVIPALFGVFLLCRRRWRAALGMAAGGLVFTVILPVLVWGPRGAWDRHLSWKEHVIGPYHEKGARGLIGRPYRSANQSLTAVAFRYLTPVNAGRSSRPFRVNFLSLDDGTAASVAKAMKALIGLGLVALWIGVRKEGADRSQSGAHTARNGRNGVAFALLYATVPPGMLLLSGVSLTTHHLLLLIPVGVLLHTSCAQCGAEAHPQRTLRIVLVAVALVWLAGEPHVKALGPLLYATLLLLGTIVYRLLREARG